MIFVPVAPSSGNMQWNALDDDGPARQPANQTHDQPGSGSRDQQALATSTTKGLQQSEANPKKVKAGSEVTPAPVSAIHSTSTHEGDKDKGKISLARPVKWVKNALRHKD